VAMDCLSLEGVPGVLVDLDFFWVFRNTVQIMMTVGNEYGVHILGRLNHRKLRVAVQDLLLLALTQIYYEWLRFVKTIRLVALITMFNWVFLALRVHYRVSPSVLNRSRSLWISRIIVGV